uniref:Queuine tRNA-ribosyltransferase accessory subunit 2 n=1 Tax=Evadne anonyx TaxID=141404 RepID=A0A9N6ZF28_9CRUS|nr:EOG090X08JG [Evadne anonyx]
MMKFTINNVASSGARLGLLSDLVRIPDAVLETPYLLLHTRGASVPYLSYDLLQMVTTEHQMLQVPLATVMDTVESVKSFGKGITEFAGLKEHFSYVTLQDSGILTPEGYHDKNSVSMWARGGRKLLNPSSYIAYVEGLKPDIFQMLCDGDTTVDSSSKRVKKSVDSTLKFAAHCASLKDKSEVLKQTPIFACVAGGYNVKERLRCIKSLKELNVSGYILEGFHLNGESATNLNWEDVEPVLTEILVALPETHPRVFPGPITPCTLLRLVSKGIDIYDATFPWLVAERNGALIFPHSMSYNGHERLNETLPLINNPADAAKKEIEEEDKHIHRLYEINLKEKRFFSDPKPLVDNCSCYTCRKYSRAYLHHLLVTGELLAPILLMMHNLHHYLCFFQEIRLAIKENRLENLQKKLEFFIKSRNN